MYYIFVFRSRAQSIDYYNLLRANGISAKLINTPVSLSVGCGLSVSVPPTDVDRAIALSSPRRYSTFMGLFYFNGVTIERVHR